MNSQRTHVGSYKVIKEILSDQNYRLTKVCYQEREYLIRSFPIMTAQTYLQPKSKRKCEKLVVRCLKYLEISHPHIEKIAAIFPEEEIRMVYIHVVVEWSATSADLLDFIENRNHLNRDKLKALMLRLTSAISELHSENIIHNSITLRSVKRQEFEYKFIFPCLHEIAQFQRKNLGYENMELDYTPPEILNNEAYEISADIWSLGILFLQLITGISLELGSAQRQATSNKQELMKVLPNKQCVKLIKGMLEPLPIFRLTIYEVQEIIQKIHFMPIVYQSDSERKIDRLYEVFSLNLFKDKEPERPNPFTQIRNKQLDSQIIRIHQIKNKYYSVLVQYDSKRDLIILYLTVFRHKRIIMTEINFDDVSLKIKEYFVNICDLFNEIRTCTIERVKIGSDGTLQFQFDKQRCDLLQQIIKFQAENTQKQKKYKQKKQSTQPINQQNKSVYNPLFFDPSQKIKASQDTLKTQKKQDFTFSKFEKKVQYDQYYARKKEIQYFLQIKKAYHSRQDEKVLRLGVECLKLQQKIEICHFYKLQTYFWLSESSKRLKYFDKCYVYCKEAQKFMATQQYDTFPSKHVSFREALCINIIFTCLVAPKEAKLNEQIPQLMKALPNTYTSVLIFAYYDYLQYEIISKRSPFLHLKIYQILYAVRNIFSKIIIKDERINMILLQFSSESFASGKAQLFDFGLEIMTELYDFIKLDLTKPKNEKIYNRIVSIFMHFIDNYPIYSEARSQILAWVQYYSPHLKEVLFPAESYDIQQSDL